MVSPTSGTPSGSTALHNSCPEEKARRVILEQRKHRRMLSNRESARRCRMKKQKHLDDLTAQVCQLRAENNRILSNTNVVTELYSNIESENSVLRAQMSELIRRVRALNDTVDRINSVNTTIGRGYTNAD